MVNIKIEYSCDSILIKKLKKKTIVPRHGDLLFKQNNKLSITIREDLPDKIISCYIKLNISMEHRKIFQKIAHN